MVVLCYGKNKIPVLASPMDARIQSNYTASDSNWTQSSF